MRLKTKIRGIIEHLAIDSTGLKVYDEGEWKVKKHAIDDKRLVWRKLHIAVDIHTHEIIGVELSLSNMTDAEVMPNLLKQIHREIRNNSGDGAYGTEPVMIPFVENALLCSSHLGNVQCNGNKDLVT